MTVLVAGVIRVLFVAVIFVFVVSGELLLRGFFCELHTVEGVPVGDVGVVRSGYQIFFVVCLGCCKMVLGGEFEMMSSFTMRVKCFLKEFVVVLGNFVLMFGHNGLWVLGFADLPQ